MLGEAGEVLVTLPAPAPSFETVNVNDIGGALRSNAAVTDLAASIVTAQLPIPEQAPLHPAKTEPGLAVAASVTTVPFE